MSWDIEYTDEFETWWRILTEDQQDDVVSVVQLLEESGTQLYDDYLKEIREERLI